MLVFVYGTLMRGYGNHYIMQEAQGRFITVAKIENHDIYYAYQNSFPAVVKGKGTVYGEIFEIPDEPIRVKTYTNEIVKKMAVKVLDRLEGYHIDSPETSMYIRKKAKAITPNGKELWVQLYIWNRKLDQTLKIPSGRWGR